MKLPVPVVAGLHTDLVHFGVEYEYFNNFYKLYCKNVYNFYIFLELPQYLKLYG